MTKTRPHPLIPEELAIRVVFVNHSAVFSDFDEYCRELPDPLLGAYERDGVQISLKRLGYSEDV